MESTQGKQQFTVAVFRLALIGLCLSLNSCGNLNNDYDSVRYRCGVDRPDGYAAVKILSSDALSLDRNSVDIRLLSIGNARVLPASDQGCVFLAIATLQNADTSVAIRHGDRQSAILLTPKDLPGFYNEIRLEEKPLHFLSGSPKVDCLTTHRKDTKSAFGLTVEAKDELNLYNVEAKIKKSNTDAPERVLVKNAADFGVIPLPSFGANYNGNYTIDVKLSDLFSTTTASVDTCTLRVDTEAPTVEVQQTAADSMLRGIDDSSSYQPGMPIDFKVWDNSAVGIYYCLVEGHQNGAKCDSKFNLAEGSINAPESGKWTLFYYGKDAAGWQTEIRSYKFIVVNRDRLQTIFNRTAATELSLEEHRLNYSYSQIFQSLLDFFDLPSPEERTVVKASLHHNVNKINQRYQEIFRTADMTKSYSWMRYAPNGYLLAERKSDQTLEIFDDRFNLVHSISSVAFVSPISSEYFIAKQLGEDISGLFTYEGDFIGESSLSYSAKKLGPAPWSNFLDARLNEQSEKPTRGFAIFDRYGDRVDNEEITPRMGETLEVLHVSASGNLALINRLNTETGSDQVEVYQTNPLRKIATHKVADHCKLKTAAVSDDRRHVVMALVSSVHDHGAELYGPSRAIPANTLWSQHMQGSCGLISWNIQDNTYRSHIIRVNHPDSHAHDLITSYPQKLPNGENSNRLPLPTSLVRVAINIIEGSDTFVATYDHNSAVFYWQFDHSEGRFSGFNSTSATDTVEFVSHDGRIIKSDWQKRHFEYYVFDKKMKSYPANYIDIPATSEDFENILIHPTKSILAGIDTYGQIRAWNIQSKPNHTIIKSNRMQPCFAGESQLWTYHGRSETLRKVAIDDGTATVVIPFEKTPRYCGTDAAGDKLLVISTEGEIILFDEAGQVSARYGENVFESAANIWGSWKITKVMLRGPLILILNEKQQPLLMATQGNEIKKVDHTFGTSVFAGVASNGLSIITVDFESVLGLPMLHTYLNHWHWTGEELNLVSRVEIARTDGRDNFEVLSLINQFNELVLPDREKISIISLDDTVTKRGSSFTTPVPINQLAALSWDYTGHHVIIDTVDGETLKVDRSGTIIETLNDSWLAKFKSNFKKTFDKSPSLEIRNWLNFDFLDAVDPKNGVYKILDNYGQVIASYRISEGTDPYFINVITEGRTVYVDDGRYTDESIVFKIRTFEEEVQTLCDNTQPTWALGEVDWADAATDVCNRFGIPTAK